MPIYRFLDCLYTQKRVVTGGSPVCAQAYSMGKLAGNKGTNNIPASCSQPLTEFPKDLSKLPTVSFVIPDMDNDMHNIGAPGDDAAIQRGDKWLKDNLDTYVSANGPKHITACSSLLLMRMIINLIKIKIPTLFIGAKVNAGKYSDKIVVQRIAYRGSHV